jgi:hypothetical protein
LMSMAPMAKSQPAIFDARLLGERFRPRWPRIPRSATVGDVIERRKLTCDVVGLEEACRNGGAKADMIREAGNRRKEGDRFKLVHEHRELAPDVHVDGARSRGVGNEEYVEFTALGLLGQRAIIVDIGDIAARVEECIEAAGRVPETSIRTASAIIFSPWTEKTLHARRAAHATFLAGWLLKQEFLHALSNRIVVLAPPRAVHGEELLEVFRRSRQQGSTFLRNEVECLGVGRAVGRDL